MKLTATILMLALATATVEKGAAENSAARVELLSAVEVRGADVYLADALPASASAALREAARTVRLAASPVAGTTRSVSGREISAALENSETLRGQLSIPGTVSVTRAARYLSTADVARLIGSADSSGIRAPQVALPAGSELELLRTSYDSAARQTHVFIRARDASPGGVRATILAATVEGKIPMGRNAQSQLTGSLPAHTSAAAGGKLPARHPANIAAHRGRRATGLIEVPGMRITQVVTPLRDGAVGDRIEVRELGSRRNLQAVVIEESLVRLLPTTASAPQVAGGRGTN